MGVEVQLVVTLTADPDHSVGPCGLAWRASPLHQLNSCSPVLHSYHGERGRASPSPIAPPAAAWLPWVAAIATWLSLHSQTVRQLRIGLPITLPVHSASPSWADLTSQAGQGSSVWLMVDLTVQRMLSPSSGCTSRKDQDQHMPGRPQLDHLMRSPSHGGCEHFYQQMHSKLATGSRAGP